MSTTANDAPAKTLRKISREKLDALYLSQTKEGPCLFVQQCLTLLASGYDLAQYFLGAEEVFGPLAEEGLAALFAEQSGFIYLAAHPGMPAGVHKVGLTRRTPEVRMKSLVTSGVLGPFVLVKSWPSMNVAATEAACFKAMADIHVNGEFYLGHYKDLVTIIDRVLIEEARSIALLRHLSSEKI